MVGRSCTRMKNATAVTIVLTMKPFTGSSGLLRARVEHSPSAQQGSRPDGVARVEREQRLAGAVGRAFDLGDDAWVPANVRAFGDHPGVEHRFDDRPVAEQLARC